MKKSFKLLLLLVLFMPFTTYAADMTYAEAQSAVKEVMQAWYMRGALRQYNNPRNTYGKLRHPEDATTQDCGYSVCSGFTGDVWMEAFGIKNSNSSSSAVPGGTSPQISNNYNDQAENYLKDKKCKSSTSSPSTGCKGEYVIFFAKNDNGNITSSYYYKNKTSFSDFIQLVQPGDLFAYDGHVLMAYDLKKNSSGKVTDVLLLNSVGGSRIYTKIDEEFSTHHMRYNKTVPATNNILDLDQNNAVTLAGLEGTTKFLWLSNNEKFVKDGKITCNFKGKRCSVTRAYYKSGSNAAFNYKITWPEQIKTSLLRTKLPGIFIHKTSSKYDNASVNRGNEITYTVRITNYSNITNKGSNKKTYSKFYLEENLPDNTTFVSKTYDDGIAGTYNSNTNSVKWTISSLKPGESKLYKFTVKVKTDYDLLGKKLTETGKVYIDSSASIGTGTIKHEIIRTNYTTADEYESCYNKANKDGKTGLSLINETYKCVYGDNYNIDLTKLTASYLNKMIVDATSGSSKRISLNTNSGYKKYTDIILDSYWNGMVKNSSGQWDLPKFLDSATTTEGYIGGSNRAKTIYESHFKTGDVLIYSMTKDTKYNYTSEDGIYAFIYLNGEFKGINYNGKSNQRNKYVYTYYSESSRSTKLYNGKATTSNYTFANYQALLGKDRYVILRPEKTIKQLASIKVSTKPTKIKYFKGATLDLTGGKLTLTNNDGTTSTVNLTASGVKVTGYDKTKVGEQTLTVTYKKKTATFKVTVVEKSVTKIAVKTNPTKTEYIVGQDLVLTGGVIKVTYSDDSTKDISMTNSNVKATGYNKNTAGEQTITLTYSSKTTTFNVLVNNKVITKLTIKSLPNKLSYTQGQELNLTGGELTKKYNDNTTATVSMSNSSVTVTGYDKNTVGAQTITVETEGKRITFEVTVIRDLGPAITKEVESISISNYPKTEYKIGDQLDLTNGTLKIKYLITSGSNTSTEFEILSMTDSNVSTSGFSSSAEGEKIVTVSYGGKSTTYNVTVSKKTATIKGIKIKKKPTKVKYVQYKDELDLTGGIITVEKSDDSEEDVSITDQEIEVLDFDNSELGKITLTVLYKGCETTFDIEIIEEAPDESIKDIKIYQKPNKTVYVKDRDGFDLTGFEITVEYKDGTKEVIKLEDHPDDYTVVGFDNTKLGEQQVTIIYKGHKINLNVKVVATEQEAQEEGEYVPIPNTFSTKSILIIFIGLIMIGTGIWTILKFNKKRLDS